MYKVTNKTNHEVKFYDRFQGKDIFLKAEESVLVRKSIEESAYFRVELVKPIIKKKLIKSKEEK